MDQLFVSECDVIFDEINLNSELYKYWYNPRFLSSNFCDAKGCKSILSQTKFTSIDVGIHNGYPYSTSSNSEIYIYRRNQWILTCSSVAQYTFNDIYLITLTVDGLKYYDIRNGSQYFVPLGQRYTFLTKYGDVVTKNGMLYPFLNWNNPNTIAPNLNVEDFNSTKQYIAVTSNGSIYIYDKTKKMVISKFDFRYPEIEFRVLLAIF